MKDKLSVIIIVVLALSLFVLAYYLKDRMNIDIFPHRHMIFFRQ